MLVRFVFTLWFSVLRKIWRLCFWRLRVTARGTKSMLMLLYCGFRKHCAVQAFSIHIFEVGVSMVVARLSCFYELCLDVCVVSCYLALNPKPVT